MSANIDTDTLALFIPLTGTGNITVSKLTLLFVSPSALTKAIVGVITLSSSMCPRAMYILKVGRMKPHACHLFPKEHNCSFVFSGSYIVLVHNATVSLANAGLSLSNCIKCRSGSSVHCKKCVRCLIKVFPCGDIYI